MGLVSFVLAASLSASPSSEVLGPIFEETVAPHVVRLNAAKRGRTVLIRINSPGGQVDAGLELAKAIATAHRRGVKVVCEVENFAASMAANLFQVCPIRRMRADARLLFHEPVILPLLPANVHRLREYLAELDAANALLAALVLPRVCVCLNYFEAVRDRNWVLTADEAKQYCLVDEVIP
jgi:ATP-dependent protease ClpP protease subunit